MKYIPYRPKSKRQVIRERLYRKGYTYEEIDDIESAEGDRKYHEKVDMEMEGSEAQ